MIIEVLRTKPTLYNENKDISKTIENLTKEMGISIGSEFRRTCETSPDAEEAVERWIGLFQVLQEFDKKPWFRKFMTVLSEPSIKASLFGYKQKVYLSLIVGYFDCGTDIYALYIMYMLSLYIDFRWNFGYILTNLILQLIVVLMQTQGLPLRTILLELLSVWLFIKPALDAHRFVNGININPNALLSNMAEMILGKCSELFAEAIPCGLHQMKVWIQSGDMPLYIAISILISAASIGYTSALISYNFDTSREYRKKNKRFYG